jgi:hypothetical protein
LSDGDRIREGNSVSVTQFPALVYDAPVLQTSLVTFLYLLSIFGWGELVTASLARRQGDFIDYISKRLLLGSCGMYGAFVVLSYLGVLRSLPVAIVLLAGVAVAALRLRPAYAQVAGAMQSTLLWDGGLRVLLGLLVALAALQIVCGLTPLVLYDSQIYQLLAPVQFLQAGSLVHIPWNVLTNAPLALQLTLGISWIADPSGGSFKLLMAVFGCLLLLAAARIGRELGLRSALLACLFVACYPEFWINQAFGVVDLATAAFLLFGLFWWRDALREDNWRGAVHAGLAFGMVMASRYHGIIFVALSLLFVLIDESSRNSKAIRRNVIYAATVIAVAAVIVAPWLIRNYQNFGNPVYPLLHNVIGGAEWSASQAARFQVEVMGRPLSDLPAAQKILAPVSALLMVPSNGLFGLLLLCGSFVGVSAGCRDLRICALLGITGLVIWGFMHPTTGVNLLRFNAAGLVLMLGCTGAVLGSERLREWKGTHAGLVLAFGSLVIGVVAMQGVIPVWQTLTDANARTLFWRANVPSWEVFEFANARLDPQRDKILLIGESRGLWLNIPFIAPTAFNGPQLDAMFAGSSQPDWTHRLRALGVTHLLISFPEWGRFQSGYNYFRPSNDFNLWLRTLPVLFDDGRGGILLAVR